MSRRLRRPRRMRRRPPVPPEADGRVRLRARGAPDLLALIPYQLGFHPSESVVAVFVRSGRIGLVARFDLPAPASASAFAAELRSLARKHRMEEVVLFGYSERTEPARALLAGLVQLLPRRLVHEALYVDGSRWWSMTCDQACCPTEGTPYDVDGHRLAAEAVYAGMSTRASREDLAATVAGPPEDELDHLAELAEEVRASLSSESAGSAAAERLVDLVEAGLGDGRRLDDRTCAELAWLVTEILVRDLAWAMISPASAEEHLAVWLRVVSRVSPDIAAGPLALAGIAGWMSGDGALLNCAADQLLQGHPGYSMGELLATISAHALPPSVGGEIHQDLQREFERLAG